MCDVCEREREDKEMEGESNESQWLFELHFLLKMTDFELDPLHS